MIDSDVQDLQDTMLLLIEELREQRATLTRLEEKFQSLEELTRRVLRFATNDHDDFAGAIQKLEGRVYDLERGANGART